MSEQAESARRGRRMRVALELQDAEHTSRAHATDEQHDRAAAAEVGLDPRFLDAAELEIARQDAAEEEAARSRAAQRSRVGRVAAVALVSLFLASVIAFGAARFVFPAPPEPWLQPMDSAVGWSLDVDPNSRASLRFAEVQGRGMVAEITVERFVPGSDGQYRANLDGFGIPTSLRGYDTVSVDLAGTLPAARLYLEAGANERWRSPALSVTGDWQTHAVPIGSFEHQRRSDGRWKTIGQGDVPTGLTQLSVKVGHFMNPPEAQGTLSVDAITLR